MSDPGTIVRIAAKGDGVTADGRHVAGAAPGDTVRGDGTLETGPHHVAPPCRHFGKCGGCQLQHCDEEVLAQFVTSRVVNAASGQGLEPALVAPAHLSPPRSRRRATLHAERIGKRVILGFREGGSHRTVDLAQCHVLREELFALVEPLRAMLARQPGKRLAVDLEMTLADQGVDLGIKGLEVEGLAATEALLDFAQVNGLARLTIDQGYGAEAMWVPEPVTVTLGGVRVPLPPGAFLQATRDGEAALADLACRWLAGAGAVADLFSGLGTFAFALARSGAKVLAAEADQRAHIACKDAAGRAQLPVHSLHRDLFRNPLRTEELDRFAGIVLDPPRAGAREQVRQIAASQVPRIVYISCNPSSWARDAVALVEQGYRLAERHPVGQFRWSTHVELASLFTKEG
ncbi:MAG: class I SAM-dependent RNA methyltransferase [Novosphingobium sp.]|nr:class I SAM-dependent RNA methyltransferase [Novosphingobium sp.]